MSDLFRNSTGYRRLDSIIRLLSIAVGSLCAGVARAELEAAPVWAEAAPMRFECRDWAEPVLAAVTNNPSIAVEGGRLQSNTTWDASKTHLVFNTVYVPNGVTLTIGEGAVVKYCPGTTINVEDGGKLSIVGADGNDVILAAANNDGVGEAVAGFEPGLSIAFEVVRLQSGSATFTDNGWLQTRGFDCASFPGVSIHGTDAMRKDGVAYVSFTLSGTSRDTAFSVDWEAVAGTAVFGEDYTLASGRISWEKSGEGTKTLQIPLNTANIIDEERTFTVRIKAAHGANIVRGEATVRIVERYDLTLEWADEWAEAAPMRFECRDWAEPVLAAVTNNPSIAVEGGRLQSNTTWDSSKTHLVFNTVYVPSGVTLTIGAGAVVKYCPGTTINVEDGGKLSIVGADGSDVILTAANDDSVGEAVAGFEEGLSITFEGIRLQSGNATFTDNGWLESRGFSIVTYPTLTLHDAVANRKSGIIYLPVTVDGSTRNQSFSVEWAAEDGTAEFGRDYTTCNSGRLTWSKSGEGTKYITIPLMADVTGSNRTFTVKFSVARACNIARGAATATIADFSNDGITDVNVGESSPSPEFPIVEGIKLQPIFLNDTETIQYSGKWQTYDSGEAAALRVTLSTDNGTTVLKECPPSETGAFDLDLTKYPVGYYTLKHEVVNTLGETLATMQKAFSIVDKEAVVLHGGVLASNEVWTAGKVHVVYQAVVVPSTYTIMIESGTIVKFMPGSKLVVESGGTCIAKGVKFTHAYDDTVGGDTLFDGAATLPVMEDYEIIGTVTDDDSTEWRYTAPVVFSGTISQDTRWRGWKVYRVSGNLTVASGKTLTVEPGAIVKFNSGVSLTVASGATLIAQGTRAQPIVFTSVKDDEHGGDTNGDQDMTLPQPGDWTKICISGGTASFDYARILYSSSDPTTGAINMTSSGGNVTFSNGEIAHAAYDAVGVESGNCHVSNSVIRDCLLAFRHWTRDPIVNCVIYDCGRLTQGGGQHFYNCVFSRIIETWEAFGFPQNGTTYQNCVFWNEGGSVLTAEGRQDAMDVCGKNGNVWGDPLFLDPDNGDFRIPSDSPCVDTGLASYAPAADYYGQPRVNAPDIGIYEAIPRGIAGDVDLVPQSVITDAAAAPGSWLTVTWDVANHGGATANAQRRDTVSLVSASGRTVELGEKLFKQHIAAGGTVRCEALFTVPAISEGTWYPKVVVNSYQDIFEGTLIANNALTATDGVEVALPPLDPAEPASGAISAGVPTVLKLSFAESDDNRMVRLDVPAGVKVTYGLGFMPTTGGTRSGAFGSIVATSDGAMFRVPDDATDVYVVLESDATAPYAISTESTKLAITSVTPTTLPSSGTTTLTISGAGFGDECAVSLSSAVGSYRVQSTVKDASGNLVATVDCAALKAGQTYDLVVSGGSPSSATATLPGAVHVAAVKGEGKFWARLVVPDSVREGRKVSCAIEYGNSGNADLPAQVLQVRVVNNGSLLYVGNPRKFSDIHFIAVTAANGCIAAGDSGKASFILLAGASSELLLHTASLDDGILLSDAAATVFARCGDMNDYRLVVNELSEDSAIGSDSFAEYRSCYPNADSGISLIVDVGEHQNEVITITAKNIETLETYAPVSMEDGIAKFAMLPAGGYKILAESEESIGMAFATVGYSPETVTVAMNRKILVSGTVESPSEDDIAVFIGGDNTYCAMVGEDGAYCITLPAGIYDAILMSPSGVEHTLFTDLEIDSDSEIDFAKTKTSSLTAFLGTRGVSTRSDYDDGLFENKYTQARKRIVEGMRLLSLAHSAYIKPTGDYDCPHNWEIYLENYREAEMFRFKLETFMKNARMADPYKAFALLGKSVHDTARAYLDYWLASKAKFATARYGKWAGGIFSAKQKIASYVFVKGLDAIEAQMGTFETDVQSLQYLLEHRELSIQYVTQVLDKIATIKDGFSSIKGDLDALAAAGTILHSDVEMFESDLFGEQMWDYINTAATIAELVSDWLKTGEAGGEWVAGRWHINEWMADFEAVMRDFADGLPPRPYLMHCCDMKDSEDISDIAPVDMVCPTVPRSIDPNEMVGELGVGDSETERLVKPGQELTYTIYFENKTNATAAAQEVYVSQALSDYLDWSTFQMGEVAFGNQIDLGLAEKKNGSHDATMEGTNFIVRTSLSLDETTGLAVWYMRIVDPTTDTGWPKDILAGFLPPNDPETHCGEGHITYRVKVRKDAPAGALINASATIIFDSNEPIPTDPAWWNTVATMATVTINDGDGAVATQFIVGQPYGALPTPKARAGYTFGGWYTGPNGTGTKITPETIVQAGVTGIYQHWVLLTYSVVFNPNGGSGAMAPQAIAPGAGVALNANKFTKPDNVFLGWATSANGAVVYADKTPVKDLAAVGQSATLYAQWAVLKYTAKFNGNGGKLPKEKKMKALAMTYGTSKKLSKNLFTRKGYVFIGWSTKKKGPVEYANKASVKNLTTKGGAVTLYAQWAKEKYKVAFYPNGGKGAMAAQTIKYGKATKLSKNKFTAPKGGKFAGWATSKANAKAGKVAYKDGKSVKNLVTTGKTVKLYAVWTKK